MGAETRETTETVNMVDATKSPLEAVRSRIEQEPTSFSLNNEPPRVKTHQLVLLDGVGERKPATVKPLAGQQDLFTEA